MFTNFTHHQILQYTKDTKSNTHKISVTQIHTKIIHSRIFTKYCSMFHNFTSDQQFTSYKILSLLFPMMITIHQRNRNVSNDDDTFSKSTQNSLPWVLPDKYITDWLTIQLIWVCSLHSPYSSHPRISHCLKNPMFCFHWWVTIHQWTEFQYPIPLMSKFPVLSISLFSAESGQHSNRKVPCFTNKVLEWYKHVFQIHNFPWWQDQSYSSANYIHCSAKLSVTFHNSQFTMFLCPIQLRGWASDFFLEGRHLSKIRLGANVTLIEFFTR